MGLEVGWYLRFARTDRIEALVAPRGVAQVRHEMHSHPGWSLEVEERGDHALTRMTRIKPVYSGVDAPADQGTES
ncbi:hypothetical protein GKC30_14140 [Pseudodesulfovibrio sp. F-1]|uniref:Uncharacterized protein n=1 Tax=Pseudodesulfovibrio alkaliphilus TaxID=2661613 RepID=A0A7K1KRR3_9BACT|nr:hypothetical protein [Pseudodesulfovibrio alkaliphilus]